MPLTIAHELAHTRGVMREDDASQLAFYVCLNSDSPYLRYSAYAATFYQLEVMVSETYISAAERENLHPIDTTFNLSRNYVNSYWAEHDLLGDIGDKINDLYIKSSGIEDGTDSYNWHTSETNPVTLNSCPLYIKNFILKNIIAFKHFSLVGANEKAIKLIAFISVNTISLAYLIVIGYFSVEITGNFINLFIERQLFNGGVSTVITNV